MSDNKDKKDAVAVKAEAPKKKGGKKKGDDGMDIKRGELSEEDQRIKEEVTLLVARMKDTDAGLATTAAKAMGELLRTATGTVASIPKPLKYVRPFYEDLLAHANSVEKLPHAKLLFDVLALIAMTMELKTPYMSLLLKQKGTTTEIAKWGHEFLKHLAGDVAGVWAEKVAAEESTAGLETFVDQILVFMMTHQDEPSACDLAMEIGQAAKLAKYVDGGNYGQVCQYLLALAKYLPAPEDSAVIGVVFDIYMKMNAYPNALIVALAVRSDEKVATAFAACTDEKVKKQMALICGRCRCFYTTDDEELDNIIGNEKIGEFFKYAAKDLDSMKPKTHEDIYKTHLMDKNQVPQTANSHMHNLATTFVNCFANAGFSSDPLLSEQGTTWIYQTKDHRMLSATASLGVIHLWDSDNGLAAADKYSYAEDNYIKAGSLLATGLLMCGIRSPFDPALGLLSDYTTNINRDIRIGAILGLGYAYAGTHKEEVKELLLPLLVDPAQPLEIQSFAAYALSLVFVGTCNADVCEATMTSLMDKTAAALLEPCARYLILALCLLFLGAGDGADAMLEAVKTLPTEIEKYTELLLLSCAYAGTGNVVVVQKLFTAVAEKEEKEDAPSSAAAAAPGDDPDAAPAAAADDKKKDEKKEEEKATPLNYKAVAVMGVGLVAMGEDLGAAMSKRAILHTLLTKDDAAKSGKRGVPLALALLSVSDPQMPVVENLSKLSHDSDVATAQAATMGLGIVSAGSNNARVATLLRALSGYYSKDKDHNHLFVVRIAQGLLHLGKGHITLSPRLMDNAVLNPNALAGLVTLAVTSLDLKATALDKYHYMLFSVVLAANPRMLLPVDPVTMEPKEGVEVRVGNAVDTVALPGKPKSITGFQTHKAPVLTNQGERAELVPGKFVAHTPVLEGVFVVTEKPKVDDDAAAPA